MLLYLSFLLGLLGPRLISYALALLSPSRASEVYEESDSLTLNLTVPPTRWFNMGWWKQGRTETFPDAAAELCRRVAVAAKLRPGERICEVGYGFGDSTLLLAREFSPSSYVGFTSLPSQHAVAGKSPAHLTLCHHSPPFPPARRAAEAQLDPTRFRLRHGDAAKDLRTLPSGSADAVIAVDCAYHFRPRSAFLSSAHRLLARSGRLALTDLALPSKPLPLVDRLLLALVCLAAGLPLGNLRTADSYRAELSALGYEPESIEMTDISDEVWPGFLAFVARREEQLGRPGVLGTSWSGLRAYARVVRWYSGVGGGRSRLRFYLISATKARGRASKVY
ncbi:SPOSA6832_02787 [Sporobolomyces salmonicolor]|uniref:SPOSA6832_02787-mRNA-1:cds n=1 Tax=Sporidiobolus salmonicolor TaxID=5005 RepID=A0A0D6EM85_SPOSA|nr:SPOSA6832_02787 [Sporobolomyces salmonicolor]